MKLKELLKVQTSRQSVRIAVNGGHVFYHGYEDGREDRLSHCRYIRDRYGNHEVYLMSYDETYNILHVIISDSEWYINQLESESKNV